MKKVLFTSCILFSAVFALAQQKIELVNSGELINKGIELHDAEKYDEAIALFKKVPVNDTNYVLMLAELVNSYSASKQDSLALVVCDEALKYESEFELGIRVFKANALDNLNRFDEAVAVYDQGQKDYPTSHVFYYEKGVAMLKKERYKEAHDLFVKTIQINPYYHPAHYQMATLAVLQGKYIPAMLAWSYYLILENSSKRASMCVGSLQQFARVEYEFKDVKKVDGLSDKDDFAELESIVKSKIALSPKYKAKIKLNFDLTKQLQLILEKMVYDKSDEGFYVQHYAKFFVELNKNKFVEPFLLTILSGSNIDEVNKQVSKKKSDIEKYNKWAVDYIHDNYDSFEAKINGSQGVYPHYFTNSKLSAIGNITGGKREGYWNYYYATGKLKSEGSFANDKRNGVWKFYHATGALKEKTTYKDDNAEGAIDEYYESGGVKSKLFVKANVLSGTQETYHPAGTIKGSFGYANGKPDGKTKTYHSNGKVREEYTLVNEKIEGEIVEYSKHARVVSKITIKAGSKEGPSTGYFDDEKNSKRFEGAYLNDKAQGKWTYYYSNGNIESTGEYVKGEKAGKWISNFRNGKIESEEEFSNGEYDGPYKTYSKKTGKPLEEFVYKNGVLQQFKQYDLNGKEIAAGKREKKELKILLFYENGNKRREGIVHDNKQQGEWKDYNINGNVTLSTNYKDGSLEGTQTKFHENGSKSSLSTYKNNNLEGYYQEFNEIGTVITEGNYVEDVQQGTWKYYYNNGTLKASYYFLNGDLTGWQKHYACNGKLSYEDYYQDGFMSKITYLDTTGKILNKCLFPIGTGEITSLHINGKDVLLKGQYKSNMAYGEFKRYSIGNKLRSVTPYIDGEEHGKQINQDLEGNITFEGDYFQDELHGKALYYFPGKKLKEEVIYVYGIKEGPNVEYYENGKIKAEYNYVRDEIEGQTTYYSEDGSLIYTRNFEDGLFSSYSYLDKLGKAVPSIPVVNGNGKFKAYFSNGNTSIEGELTNGMRNGVRKIFHSNGKVAMEENFLNGNLHGKSTTYYASGKVKTVKNYHMGDLHGTNTHYYENGKVEKEERYLNDDEHGLFKFYSTEGKLNKTQLYYDGTLIEEKVL